MPLNIKTSTTSFPTASSTSTSPVTSTCYFAYQPATYSHYSVETPCISPDITSQDAVAEPFNPLLARRSSSIDYTAMDASKVLQLQTQAAYQQPSRSNSNSSTSSSSSASSTTSRQTMPVRCARCHQESIFGTAQGMVSFGTNLYYCKRCANIVGYGT